MCLISRHRRQCAIRIDTRTSWLAALLAVSTPCAFAARAQDTALPLTLAANPPLSITVPATGSRYDYELVFLSKVSPEPALTRHAPELPKFTFCATPFVGAQQGDSIPVEIALPDNPARGAAATQKDVALTGNVLVVLLQIPPLPNEARTQAIWSRVHRARHRWLSR
jgi:hypothetical protein